jgi:hypothetical protein
VSDTWLAALVAKHGSRGILVDANLLFLHCAGLCNPAHVSRIKGTREYSSADYQLIDKLLGQFKTIFATPNILTEVSNLVCRLGLDLRVELHNILKQRVRMLEERYVSSEDATTDAAFTRLGLSDAATAKIGAEGVLILTNDLDLSLSLERRGWDFIHYDRMLRPYTLELD